jgi:hypothetical protein
LPGGERIYAKPASLIIPSTNTECAYLARILDGEGCISRLTKQRRWTVSIASTDVHLITWLERIGGTKTTPQLSALSRKIVWKWQVASHRDIQLLLKAVLPYLIIKKEKSLQAIQEIDMWITEIEMCRNGLHNLNETGRIYSNGVRKCVSCKNETNRRWRRRQREKLI